MEPGDLVIEIENGQTLVFHNTTLIAVGETPAQALQRVRDSETAAAFTFPREWRCNACGKRLLAETENAANRQHKILTQDGQSWCMGIVSEVLTPVQRAFHGTETARFLHSDLR